MSNQPKPKTTVPADLTVERVRADLERAARGDAATLPTVRHMLQLPKLVEEWGGNLARKAEGALLDQIAGENLLFREALWRKAEMMRAELNGADASVLDTIVVERVVANWLQVYYAEALLAQAKGWTLAQSDAWQRRIDRAHRRLLSSVKALASIRRLTAPVVMARVNRALAGPASLELGQV